jgi:hypothetical protein
MDREQRSVAELLTDYSDQRTQGNTGVMEIAGDGLSNDEELRSLLQVARQVKCALQPVRMPMAAKRRLRTDILESTRLARSRDVVVATSPSNRGLFIGAAVALAGGIAYLIRARTHAD